MRCVKTSLHHRISVCICVCFFLLNKFVPKKPDFVVVRMSRSPPKRGRPPRNEKKQDDSVAREHFQSLEPEEDRSWFSGKHQ